MKYNSLIINICYKYCYCMRNFLITMMCMSVFAVNRVTDILYIKEGEFYVQVENSMNEYRVYPIQFFNLQAQAIDMVSILMNQWSDRLSNMDSKIKASEKVEEGQDIPDNTQIKQKLAALQKIYDTYSENIQNKQIESQLIMIRHGLYISSQIDADLVKDIEKDIYDVINNFQVARDSSNQPIAPRFETIAPIEDLD